MCQGDVFGRLVPLVMTFALPQIAVILVLSFFISPWAAQMSDQYQSRVAARDDVTRVNPGVFGETGNKERVFFVESVSGDAKTVQNVFVSSLQQQKGGVSMSRTGTPRPRRTATASSSWSAAVATRALPARPNTASRNSNATTHASRPRKANSPW